MATPDRTGEIEMTVVVATAGRPVYLADSLESLAHQPGAGRYEVLVCDDGDDPRTAPVVRSFSGRLDVRHISHGTTRGPNAARNKGVRAARGELVAFVDDDVEAPPGWLAAMADACREHRDAEIVGSRVLPRVENPRLDLSRGESPPVIAHLDLGVGSRDVDEVASTGMVVRRSAFDRHGLFDVDAIGAEEEVEWQRRVRSAGGRIVYDGRLALVHRRAGREASLRSLARESFRRGRRLGRRARSEGAGAGRAREARTAARCLWLAARRRSANDLLSAVLAVGRIRGSGG